MEREVGILNRNVTQVEVDLFKEHYGNHEPQWFLFGSFLKAMRETISQRTDPTGLYRPLSATTLTGFLTNKELYKIASSTYSYIESNTTLPVNPVGLVQALALEEVLNLTQAETEELLDNSLLASCAFQVGGLGLLEIAIQKSAGVADGDTDIIRRQKIEAYIKRREVMMVGKGEGMSPRYRRYALGPEES